MSAMLQTRSWTSGGGDGEDDFLDLAVDFGEFVEILVVPEESVCLAEVEENDGAERKVEKRPLEIRYGRVERRKVVLVDGATVSPELEELELSAPRESHRECLMNCFGADEGGVICE
ncbi:hypothetical protein JCM8547_000985 [Rhodosporidiobolus lusitaniae]